jgi:hypothetical protein
MEITVTSTDNLLILSTQRRAVNLRLLGENLIAAQRTFPYT